MDTHRQTHKVTDSTYHPTHASATADGRSIFAYLEQTE